MNDILYPHEQVIKIIKTPNTLSEAITWSIFALSMLIIECFIAYTFGVISTVFSITNSYELFVVYGLNICCVLTVILYCIGYIEYFGVIINGRTIF